MTRKKGVTSRRDSPVLSLRPDIRKFACSQPSSNATSFSSQPLGVPRMGDAPPSPPRHSSQPTPDVCPTPRGGTPRVGAPPRGKGLQDIRKFSCQTPPPQVFPVSQVTPGHSQKGDKRGSLRWVPPKRKRKSKNFPSKSKTTKKNAKRLVSSQAKLSRYFSAAPDGGLGVSLAANRRSASPDQVGPRDLVSGDCPILVCQLNLNNSHSAKDVLDTHGSLVQLIQEVYHLKGERSIFPRDT